MAKSILQKQIPILENASAQFILIEYAKYFQIVCALPRVVDIRKTLSSLEGFIPKSITGTGNMQLVEVALIQISFQCNQKLKAITRWLL